MRIADTASFNLSPIDGGDDATTSKDLLALLSSLPFVLLLLLLLVVVAVAVAVLFPYPDPPQTFLVCFNFL